MIVKEIYQVRTKSQEKYLAVTESGYGRSISLSKDFEKAKQFKSTMEARSCIKSYLSNQKTISAKDLEIVKIEVTFNEKEVISSIPDTITIYNSARGIDHIYRDQAKEIINQEYKIDLKDFDLEEQGNDSWARTTVITNIKLK